MNEKPKKPNRPRLPFAIRPLMRPKKDLPQKSLDLPPDLNEELVEKDQNTEDAKAEQE